MVTQVEIARRVGLDVSSVNKILNRRQGPVFRKETIRKVFKIARQLGYDFGRLKYQHRRKFARKPVAIGAELTVVQRDGSVYDQGMATIRDISLGGARITDVALPTGAFPIEPFSVVLRPMQKPVENVELAGRIVRLHINGATGYGVEFAPVDASAEKKLRKIAAN